MTLIARDKRHNSEGFDRPMFEVDPVEIEGPTSDVRPVEGGERDQPREASRSPLTALGPALLLGLTFSFMSLEPSGMVGGGIAGLLLLWPVIAAVVALVSVVRGRWVGAGRAAVHLVVFGVAWAATVGITTSQVERSERSGDVIAVALERYRAAMGAYPDTLADLVPHHIREIPRPEMGVFTQQQFFYRVRDNVYLLGFDGSGMMTYTRGPDGKWFQTD